MIYNYKTKFFLVMIRSNLQKKNFLIYGFMINQNKNNYKKINK